MVVALLSAALLSSCSLWPVGPGGDIYDDDYQQADARMEQIAAAVNSQDADGLKGMFSTRSLDEATGFDEGLAYFLSFFPDGGLTWERDSVGADGAQEDGKRTELLRAYYKVSADGADYWFYFADFTVNEVIDPENVGLYALGVTPWTEDRYSGPSEPFFYWAGGIQIENDGPNGYPGIYVPE
jgi:hypothetical protein